MTEGQTLFAVVALLYLSDCLAWIGRTSVLFSSRWRNRWRSIFPGEYFGNAGGSVALLNPLPPLGNNFFGHWAPLSISPAGVCAFTLQTFQRATRPFQTGTVFSYEEISEARAEGKHLLLNGSRFAKCPTSDQAESLAGLIKKLLSQPVGERERLIRDALAARFSREAALDCLARVNRLTALLQRVCFGFFIYLFVIIPVIVSVYGLIRFLIPLVIVLFAGVFFISALYYRAHRALRPAQMSERLNTVVKMILCPPTAIRAADPITLNAISRFHPMLLANLLLGPDGLAFARIVVTDLKYPIRHDLTDPRALSIVTWHAANELEACSDFLNMQYSTTPDELVETPSWDGASSAYCPRCSCEFAAHSGECPDCPGVALVPFSVEGAPEESHE